MSFMLLLAVPHHQILDPSLLGEGTDWQDELFNNEQ
jgi:hypothetical protein